MDYSVCYVVLCNKYNAKTGFIRTVSQDYFEPDSKTDTTALKSKTLRITEVFRLDELL